MECRDRYFMIAVDLSFAGNEPRFEAVGESCAALLTPTAGNHEYFVFHLSVQEQQRWGHVALHSNVTLFQMEQACTQLQNSMQLCVDTQSVFSLYRAKWSSEPLTSAVTLTTKYETNGKLYVSHLWHTPPVSWIFPSYICFCTMPFSTSFRTMKCSHLTSTC